MGRLACLGIEQANPDYSMRILACPHITLSQTRIPVGWRLAD